MGVWILDEKEFMHQTSGENMEPNPSNPVANYYDIKAIKKQVDYLFGYSSWWKGTHYNYYTRFEKS